MDSNSYLRQTHFSSFDSHCHSVSVILFLIRLFVCLFVYLFILGRKLNRQNCLLKEVLREREEREEKEKKKSY